MRGLFPGVDGEGGAGGGARWKKKKEEEEEKAGVGVEPRGSCTRGMELQLGRRRQEPRQES